LRHTKKYNSNVIIIVNSFQSTKRLILLDYDGTLSPIVKMRHLAVPSEEIIGLLGTLCHNNKNITYVVTGRERKFMEEWFSTVPVGLSCEHGNFFRPFKRSEDNVPWQDCTAELDLSWKTAIKAIFEDYTDRTPGSFVENKEINLTWHFRNADPEFGENQKKMISYCIFKICQTFQLI